MKRRDFLAMSSGIGLGTGLILHPTPGRSQVAALSCVNLLPNSQWQIMTVVNPAPKQAEDGSGNLPVIEITGNAKQPVTNDNLLTFTCKDTSAMRVGDLLDLQGPIDPKINKSFSPGVPRIFLRVVKINSPINFVLGLSHTCYDAQGSRTVSSTPCAGYLVTRGDTDGTAVSDGIGRGPDRWWRSPQLQFWREAWSTNTQPGSRYALGIRKTMAAPQQLWCEFNSSNLHIYEDVDKLRGRQVTFGVWVRHKIKTTAQSWQIFIQQFDAGNRLLASTASTPGSQLSYQWRETTVRIQAATVKVKVGVEFSGGRGDVYYVSQPMLSYGDALGVGNYVRPNSELLTGSFNLVPHTYWGATVHFPVQADRVSTENYLSYGFPLRLDSETNGQVVSSTKKIVMQMEGRCATANRAFFLRNQENPPHIYGLGVYSKVPNMVETASGTVTLSQGDLYVYAGNSPENNVWTGVSFDISAYVL